MVDLALNIVGEKGYDWDKSGNYFYNDTYFYLSPGIKFNFLNHRYYLLTQLDITDSYEMKTIFLNFCAGYNFNIK